MNDNFFPIWIIFYIGIVFTVFMVLAEDFIIAFAAALGAGVGAGVVLITYHFLFRYCIKPQMESVNKHKKEHYEDLVNNVIKKMGDACASASNAYRFEVSSQDIDKLIETEKFRYAKQHLKRYWDFSKLFSNMIEQRNNYANNLDSTKKYFDNIFEEASFGTTKHNFMSVMWEITNKIILVPTDTIDGDVYASIKPVIDDSGILVMLTENYASRMYVDSEEDIAKVNDFVSHLLCDIDFRRKMERLHKSRKNLSNATKELRYKVEHIIVQYKKKGTLRGTCDDMDCPTFWDYLIP